MEGLVRHPGVHAAGIIIAKKSLYEGSQCVVMNDKDGSPIVNWDKYDLEDRGLMKLDVLGLNTLTILREVQRLAKERHAVEIEWEKLDLEDPKVLKLFHFGRFDIAAMFNAFGALTAPVYCTKIASRLIRTYTDRHGLKNLTQELIGVDISKQQQMSDWGAPKLTKAQLDYAASDVLHLHQLRTALDKRLAREGRTEMAQACFDFLPMRAKLDLAGWPETDIFAHS